MKTQLLKLVTGAAFLFLCGGSFSHAEAAGTKVEESLRYYKDAKFGMFIHFDVSRRDRDAWNPDNLDTDEWVRVAKDAGMKYMVPTTHQSSYIIMWDSKVSDRDVTDLTQFKQPYLKELAESCKAAGIRMGAYYAIADPGNPLYNEPDVGGEIVPYVDYLHDVIEELCQMHDPLLIWFDASRRFRDPADKMLLRRGELVDMMHSYGTLSNSRLGDDDAQTFVDYLTMNDNMAPDINLGVHWESAVELGESWHFRSYDEELKSVKEVLERLVNATGNGGNLLLNIGPDSHGVIPEKTQVRLKEIGDWVKRNEESIYGTKAGPYPYQINWGSITQRKDGANTNLYLNVVEWPTDGELTLFGLNNHVLAASLLASGKEVDFEFKFDPLSAQNILKLDLPQEHPDEFVSVIKLVVAGDASMDPNHLQLSNGEVLLDAYNARIHDLVYVPEKPSKAVDMKMFTVPDRRPQLPSDHAEPWDFQMYKKPDEGIMPGRGITVAGFGTKGQALSWDFKVYEPGTYTVEVICHVTEGKDWEADGEVRINVAGQSVEGQLVESKRVKTIMMPHYLDVHSVMGTVKIENPGAHSLTLEVSEDFEKTKLRLRGVALVPVGN